ncbi:hypothetical protein ACLB2K_016392 [Fragaria x ananassa]
MADNHISKFHGVPHEKKLEGRTEKSTLEEENSSHTDGEPQLRVIANHNRQVASFLMRDVYVDTSQPHGGQGGDRFPSLVNHQGHDQLKLCPITGRDQDAAPSQHKRNETAIMDWRRFDKLWAACRKRIDARATAEENEKALQRQNVKPTAGEDSSLGELMSKEEYLYIFNQINVMRRNNI